MGSVSWRTDRTLRQSIEKYPQHFEVNQLINLLLNYQNARNGNDNEENLVTGSDETDRLDQFLRLSSELRFDFPPSPVSYFRQLPPEKGQELGISNFGIAGIYGPLPQSYSEWLFREIAEGNIQISDFLNIFNHRLLALRYQVLARSRVSLSAKRPNDSYIARALNNLMGLGTPHLLDQLSVSRRMLQTYAGLLANARTSVQVVKCLLGSVLQTQISIRQLEGKWRVISREQQTFIGLQGANNALGTSSLLGRYTWDQKGMIEVKIGPVNYQRLLALMPDGELHGQLLELIRFLSNRDWDCRVNLLIKAEEIPESFMPFQTDNDRPSNPKQARAQLRLGRTAWLKSNQGLAGQTGFEVRVN